jgi:hypothetical protein
METRLGVSVGSLQGADLQRATDALDDASILVRAEAGLDFLAADGLTIDAPDVIVTIARRVALRQYRNPDGFVSEGMGSGAYTYRYADDETSAYLTDREAAQIHAAVAALRPAPFQGSVRTPSAYEGGTLPAVPDGGGWLMGE